MNCLNRIHLTTEMQDFNAIREKLSSVELNQIKLGVKESSDLETCLRESINLAIEQNCEVVLQSEKKTYKIDPEVLMNQIEGL